MNEEMFKAFVLPILLTCKYNITLDEADEIIKKSDERCKGDFE